jgi:hypothetical protein
MSCAYMQIKFHERTLKFKVAAGGKEEREQWVAALQAARRQQQEAQQKRNSGAGKLEHLQKVGHTLRPAAPVLGATVACVRCHRAEQAATLLARHTQPVRYHHGQSVHVRTSS